MYKDRDIFNYDFMKSIGFTGTREGMTDKQKREVLTFLRGVKFTEVHHGACRGADAEFHDLIIRNFPWIKIIIHPASLNGKDIGVQNSLRLPDSLEIKESKNPIERDHDIVNESSALIACPKSNKEEVRSGTWATIRYSNKVGKDIHIFYP